MAGLKNLKKTRRIQVVLMAFAALALALVALWNVPDEAFNYFRSPSEMATKPPAPGEVFRIGGLVEEGTLDRSQGETIRFKVTDTAASVPVRYTGILPDLFAEGAGMVALGQMEGDTFVATEILAKHDETYMPKEVIEALKEQGVYQDGAGD